MYNNELPAHTKCGINAPFNPANQYNTEAENGDILRFHQFLRASDRVRANSESQSEAIEGKVRRGEPSRLRKTIVDARTSLTCTSGTTGTPMKKAVKEHTGLLAVWAIGDPGTATVVVHIFSRITRDDVGVVFFSSYSAARLYTSLCPWPSSAPALFGSNDRLRGKPGSR